jgi:transcriptional regulator with XRE-family HTH domain
MAANTLGGRLRNLRLRAGLHVAEVAARAGIATPSLYGYERDGAVPSYQTLVALTRALGCGVEVLADCQPAVDHRRRRTPA